VATLVLNRIGLREVVVGPSGRKTEHKMKIQSPGRVLVFGDDMRIFLAVVRSLGRSGKEVHAVPFNWRAPALKSRYIAAIHRVPRYSDDPDGWLAAVRRLLEQQSFDLIVPCCDDRSILSFDRHRDAFARFRMAIPGSNAMDLLFDKAQTRALCAQLGVPITAGEVLGSADTASGLIARYGLPLVIKPARSYSLDRLDAWGKVHIAETAAELERVLAQITERERYLVEQYFDGVGTGVSVLAREGRILNAFQHRRLREGWGGSSSHRISEPIDPDLLHACKEIANFTALTGVCMFEFRFNLDTKRWILLETNARFWGSLPLPISLGVDFPRYLYDLFVHYQVHPQVPYQEGAMSRNVTLDALNLISDFRRRKRGELGSWLSAAASFVTQPVRWATGKERSDSFVWDDLLPAFSECAQLAEIIREKRYRDRVGKPRRRRNERMA
jgi:predicted ATP-grasp superfamily ATP-dependent carboligase